MSGYVEVRTKRARREVVRASGAVKVKYDPAVRVAYLLDRAIANALASGVTFDDATVDVLRGKFEAIVEEQNND